MSLIFLILVIEESRVVILLHILLRRLIHLHVCHLSSCLFLLLLLLFLSGSMLLNALKFIEYILVMKQSVRELISEGVTLEESLDSAFNDWNL